MLMLNVHSRQQVQMHPASNNELVVIKLMVNPTIPKKKFQVCWAQEEM
jgi:hypothetical protein